MAAPLVSSDFDYNTTGAPVVVAAADFVAEDGTTPRVPVAGDRVAFFFSTDAGSATLTPPAVGLTAFGAQLNPDGSMNARAWYYDLVGAPPASWSFSHDGGAAPTFLSAVCIKANGNTLDAPTTPVPVQTSTPGATSLATPDLTGGADERLMVAHWTNDGEMMTGDPSGMTVLRSQQTDAFSNRTFFQASVGTGAQSRTATYGFTESIATFAMMMSFTAPAAGPVPVSTSPDWGNLAGGTAVTITGTGFDASGGSAEGVTFGGTAATSVVFVGPTTITCVAPAHAAGAVNVVVTNGNGSTGTLVNGFTYTEGPELDPNPMDATDGSGESESDLTSDEPLEGTAGLLLDIATTIGDVTLSHAALPEEP